MGLTSTVTIWRYTYIPITVTLPLPFDLPLTCRKFNDSMACDVGAADEYLDGDGGFLKCIKDGSMELKDPEMHFLEFMPQQPGDDPDLLNIQTNFTVQHGSTMGLDANLPELTMDVYYSPTPLDESKRINATTYPGLEALSHVTVRQAELRGQTVTGLVFVQIDARGNERLSTITELIDDLLQTNINGPTDKGFFLYVQGPDLSGPASLIKRLLARMPMIRESSKARANTKKSKKMQNSRRYRVHAPVTALLSTCICNRSQQLPVARHQVHCRKLRVAEQDRPPLCRSAGTAGQDRVCRGRPLHRPPVPTRRGPSLCLGRR